MRLLKALTIAALSAGVLAAAATATVDRPLEDGTLSVRDGRATIQLRLKGSLIGRLAKGQIVVTDSPDAGATIIVRGAESERSLSDRTTVYSGRNIRFRIADDRRFVVKLAGKGLNSQPSDAVTAGWTATATPRTGVLRRVVLTQRHRPSDAAQRADAVRARRLARRLGVWHPDRRDGRGRRANSSGRRGRGVGSPRSSRCTSAMRGDVQVAPNGRDALAKAEAASPSLIVLDLMLPDIDGIEVCRRVRQRSDVPILMLTARDEDVDKIVGLEVGADDYLTKPFNPRELVARVKSILRRAAPERREAKTTQIRHGDVLSTPAVARSRSATKTSSWRRRSSTCSGSCSTTTVSCSRATSCSSGSGLHVRRRHAHRRRPHPPAQTKARRRLSDRHRLGRGLQGAPAKDASKDTVSA